MSESVKSQSELVQMFAFRGALTIRQSPTGSGLVAELDYISGRTNNDEHVVAHGINAHDALLNLEAEVVMSDKAERLAQDFHETYERLAPDFGYKTREASAKPWAHVPEQNKQLMIAVAREILDRWV